MSGQAQALEMPPPAVMLQMIQGFWVSRAIYVAAKLGIADHLKDGPKSSDELARSTATHAPSLYRVLRALDSIGVVTEAVGQRFALTPLGETLRSDVAGSLRFFAVEELGENHYPAWGKVLYSVKTGAIAFDHVYGENLWTYMTRHSDEAAVFNQAMASFSSIVAGAVVEAYDFSASRTVVDVGGGEGILLAAIVKSNPHLRGVLADVPHVAEAARSRFAAEGLTSRCDAAGVDFFQSVPPGDTLVLKWIIHDWDDARSAEILANCGKALADNGKLLLVEAVLQPGPQTSLSKFVDLNMLVMTGGRERTEREYRTLLESAGLKLARIVPTHTEMSIIEAVKA